MSQILPAVHTQDSPVFDSNKCKTHNLKQTVISSTMRTSNNVSPQKFFLSTTLFSFSWIGSSNLETYSRPNSWGYLTYTWMILKFLYESTLTWDNYIIWYDVINKHHKIFLKKWNTNVIFHKWGIYDLNFIRKFT